MDNISQILSDAGVQKEGMISVKTATNFMIQLEQRLKAEQYKNHRFYLIGEMTASLVHDLKNPLNGFSMMAESLSWIQQDLETDGSSKEELVDRLKNIESLMTKQIAEYDRRLTGVSVLAKQTEVVKSMSTKEIERLVSQTLSMFTTQFQKYDTKMLIDIEWSKLSDRSIQMNPAYLTQALGALLKNSLEALSRREVKNKWVKISLEEKDCFSLIVQDSGDTESNQNQYLEKGFSTKINGMGLGLNVSKNLLEIVAANLQFDKSQPNTTVRMNILYG